MRGRCGMFTRCMCCNAPLARVEQDSSVLDALPAAVAETYTEFSRCPGCGKVFWRGTHWERMKKLAAEVLGRQDRNQVQPGVPAQRFRREACASPLDVVREYPLNGFGR